MCVRIMTAYAKRPISIDFSTLEGGMNVTQHSTEQKSTEQNRTEHPEWITEQKCLGQQQYSNSCHIPIYSKWI